MDGIAPEGDDGVFTDDWSAWEGTVSGIQIAGDSYENAWPEPDDERWATWPEPWVGTDFDVRAVMKSIPQDVKDGFRYEALPWGRFQSAYGPDEVVPGFLEVLASEDAEAADRALGDLWNRVHHQGGGSEVGALAVPFLIRIAASVARPQLRADILVLAAEIGRCQHLGDGSREGFLQVADDPNVITSVACPVDWVVQAARDVVTDDVDLLFPLLCDADAEVRSATAYVLAVATGEVPRITAVLHDVLVVEEDPAVEVSLILALSQLAREHNDDSVASWVSGLWSDPGQPLHIRVGAGLAWLCLVDGPVPDELRTLLTAPGTHELVTLFHQVPWFPPVEGYGKGLSETIAQMLTPPGSVDSTPESDVPCVEDPCVDGDMCPRWDSFRCTQLRKYPDGCEYPPF